ncbi:MAG: class I SAM-dependent methyltransferase [Candidatus Caldarchaeum sp.]|nr:class I SAM-dependent methyltransferase [Candidatus Caldarchaeum sp.]
MLPKTYGLGDEWDKVITSLRNLVPVYDELNETISFKTDLRLRAESITGLISDGERVLDAGAGNGVFSRVLLKNQPNVADVVLLDFLHPMLKTAAKTLSPDKTHYIIGVFENLPFRENVFDSVLMGFSLRDARNTRTALSEVKRVLKQNGNLIVVDLGKPDSPLFSLLVGLYWKVVAPFLALLKLGKTGLNATSIYSTYRRLPKNNELKSIVQSFFEKVEIREKMLGGAVMLKASSKQGPITP